MIELRKAEDRELLWNIHQKYLYEMTNYYDDPMDAKGNYSYGYFDSYFTDPNRTALLLMRKDRLIGFAMIHPFSYFGETPDHVMAEFTVFPHFRRNHFAEEAVRAIFAEYPGAWEIKYHEKNTAARHFWTKVSEPYHPERREYSREETVLLFRTHAETTAESRV